jgi:hypothetical protein
MIPTTNPTAFSSARLLRTRWLAISTFCTLSFALLLTLAAGCAPSERQRVQTVSDQFLDAMAQEDWDRAKPLLTEKARDSMGRINPFTQDRETEGEKTLAGRSKIKDYTLGDPVIEDTAAAVPVTLTEADHLRLGTLRLRREDGEWRVRALRIEGENDAPGATLDFENPESFLIEATFRAVGEGIAEILKGAGRGIGAFIREVEKGTTESPQPSPDSDGAVKVEEHSGGS